MNGEATRERVVIATNVYRVEQVDGDSGQVDTPALGAIAGEAARDAGASLAEQGWEVAEIRQLDEDRVDLGWIWELRRLPCGGQLAIESVDPRTTKPGRSRSYRTRCVTCRAQGRLDTASRGIPPGVPTDQRCGRPAIRPGECVGWCEGYSRTPQRLRLRRSSCHRCTAYTRAAVRCAIGAGTAQDRAIIGEAHRRPAASQRQLR